VDAFLQGKIPFTGIAKVVEETLHRMGSRSMDSVSAALDVDRQSRTVAAGVVDAGKETVTVAAVGGPMAAV
jgi:1-deoxy-D-xylulose-5-phosphate reductoisomerase